MSDHIQIALVDESGTIDFADLAEVAGALNAQIHEDLRRAWQSLSVPTVQAYHEAPPMTWAIKLRRDIEEPGALGYHWDNGNQPFALVDVDAGDWTITASHEMLEMVGDPWGNRMHGGRLPSDLTSRFEDVGLEHASSRVHYLRELSDPCEATSVYLGGVPVSDFILPEWYRTSHIASSAYSAYGGCTRPREVAEGGYVSFVVPHTGSWWQAFNVNGQLRLTELGRFGSGDARRFRSLRAFCDYHARSTPRHGG